MTNALIGAIALVLIIVTSIGLGAGLYRLFFVPEPQAKPRVRLKVENIAKIVHEANRAYCAGLGDLSHKSWLNTEAHVKQGTISGVKHLLANPHLTPQQMHENWCATKLLQGYRYGRVKCHRSLTHPCLVAYDQLPIEQQAKDFLFHAIVKLFV